MAGVFPKVHKTGRKYRDTTTLTIWYPFHPIPTHFTGIPIVSFSLSPVLKAPIGPCAPKSIPNYVT